jgi:thioredoxin
MFVKTATDKNFKEATASKMPVIVDFYGSWCGPCKAMAPSLEKVAEERSPAISFYKVDIDDSPSTSQEFRISGVPTLIIMSEGKEVARKVGAMNKGGLDLWLNFELEKLSK